MPKAAPLQNTFDAGEVSPTVYGQVKQAFYAKALALCKNWLPTLQGPLTRRPGSVFVEPTKISNLATIVVPFKFNETQAYILEFGHLYVRFFANQAQVVSGSTPVELVTPYAYTDLPNLRWTQDADVLYLVDGKHPPMSLTRTGAATFSIGNLNLGDGPYLNQNAYGYFDGTNFNYIPKTNAYLYPSGTVGVGGTATITAYDSPSSVTPPAGTPISLFQNTDVGRWIRFDSATFNGAGTEPFVAIAKITAYISSSQVTVQVYTGTISQNGGPNSAWRISAYSGSSGYPSNVVFHEDRLVFMGGQYYPERIDGSMSSDYLNFEPTLSDLTVTEANGYSFNLLSNDVNKILWGVSDEQGLLGGTGAGEWSVAPSTQGEAISPTNINAKNVTKYGSSNVQAATAGKATIFVQKGARKLRELMWFFDVGGFRANDLNELSDHITGSGVTQIAYAKIPHPIVWCVRKDGALLAMLYDRDLSQLRVGWSKHFLGGSCDNIGTPAKVTSVAVIPSPDGLYDQLWMVVQRYIDGQYVQYIEYLHRVFEDIDNQEDAFFVDCGNTYDVPIYVQSVTNNNPLQFYTILPHGLTTGDKIIVSAVNGFNPLQTGLPTIQGGTFTVTVIDSQTITIPVDGTKYGPVQVLQPIQPFTIRKKVTHISGLSYLEGETVSIYADGAVQPSQTVSGGAITLSSPAGKVQIGYGYQSDGQQLPLEAGSQDGTALGKTRRTHKVNLMLHRTQSLKIGFCFSDLTTLAFQTFGTPLGQAYSLFSGIKAEQVDADYDYYNQFCFRVDEPVPATITAIAPQLEENDDQ